MSEEIRIEGPDENGIAIVWIDQPGKKVNVLNTNSIPEFSKLMEKAIGDSSIKAIVITSGKENCFIAGADIDMLNTIRTVEGGKEISQKGQTAMNRLASLPIPTVAAINGDCLGGGLELALACSARIVTESPRTKMALPEVMLGLLPGAGGTRRLPKLVGLVNALDMMLTGRNIRPKKALKMGLVDKVVPKSWLIPEAKKLALDLVAKRKPTKQSKTFSERMMLFALKNIPPIRNKAFRAARQKVMEQSLGLYPAPLKIIEVVKANTDAAESQSFGELLVTPESQGLRHLFRCITELKKDDGPNTKDVEAYPIERIGMLGTGLMGGGIATVLADKGYHVRLKDIKWEGIETALNYAKRFYKKAVSRKRYPQAGMDERMYRLSGTLDYSGFGLTDVVIEAVPEILQLKQEMVADIESRSKKPIIFASNTSSLPITEIAEKATHPERVIGMHFFSPVEKMPLVEIIVTEKTDPKVTKTISQLSRKMGKHVIIVNDCAGFYTTRALGPYIGEAIFLLAEGYDVRDIDLAAQEAGFPVGPITLLDEVGIDVGAKIVQIIKQYYGDRIEFPDNLSTESFLKEGRFGRKASKGFYLYKNGESVQENGIKLVDDSYKKLLPKGISQRSANKKHREALAKRLILTFVNEAARCLQEGILREPRAGDLGAIMGVGFPPMLGGPFNYIDKLGVEKIVSDLRELVQSHGKRFAPCELLIDFAESGQSIYEHYEGKDSSIANSRSNKDDNSSSVGQQNPTDNIVDSEQVPPSQNTNLSEES
jgi:3-hydroxyacyl-CoA dehydrogenase / enoyl-CoA hydratase / 3-hydroxybutyryl-CoA epimerase